MVESLEIGGTSAEHNARHTRREWLHVLLAGLGLFVVTTIVMFVTGNPNLFPTVILRWRGHTTIERNGQTVRDVTLVEY